MIRMCPAKIYQTAKAVAANQQLDIRTLSIQDKTVFKKLYIVFLIWFEIHDYFK